MDREEYIETKIAEGRMCDLPIRYSPMIHYDSRIKKYTEIATYVAVCALVDEVGDTFSLKDIAKLSRGHELTVMRILPNLKKYGYIDYVKQSGKKNRFTVNHNFKLDENYLYPPVADMARQQHPELIEEMPTVEQHRRLKDGSIVTEQEYQAMLKQPKRATDFGRGKRR